MRLLHLIASPRGEKSRTLQIANAFLEAKKAKYPDLIVDTLDLFRLNLPEVSGNVVDAKYIMKSGGTLNEKIQTEFDEILAYSTSFLSYDQYVISVPMWNFTIPYQLKHYIDIIMQAGILFRFTEAGVEGLALNKKMVCITSRGSDYSPGTYIQQFDFQEPYLRAIFGMAGIYDLSFIHAQPLDYTPELTQQELDRAMLAAVALAGGEVAIGG